MAVAMVDLMDVTWAAARVGMSAILTVDYLDHWWVTTLEMMMVELMVQLLEVKMAASMEY